MTAKRKAAPLLVLATLAALGLGIRPAQAQTITFTGSATPEGTVVSTQFGPKAYFIPHPLGGLSDAAFYGTSGSSLGTWATNTDMTVTATDLGAEAPSLAGVRQLHAYGAAYSGWLNENGDASFLIDFTAPISSITVTFVGDNTGSSGIADFSGGVISRVSHVPVGSNTVLETATLTGLNSTNILVVPGSYSDWASVVSISVTPTPEPSQAAALALGALGVAGLTLKTRKRKSIA